MFGKHIDHATRLMVPMILKKNRRQLRISYPSEIISRAHGVNECFKYSGSRAI